MPARRLGVLTLGFRRRRGLIRILELAGWQVVPGWARADAMGAWGARPASWRARTVAARRGVPLVTVEDAFLRSVEIGEDEPPLGLLIDPEGLHTEARAPSRLERMLTDGPEPSAAERARAEAALARFRALDLSKYNDFPGGPVPEPGYALVLDQVPGDASIAGGMASAESFGRMLEAARASGLRVLLRRHPRGTHFPALPAGVEEAPPGLSPAALFAGALEVHAVTSQAGFEAILHGHRPVLHGVPFYAGWGLSEDRVPVPRRGRRHDPVNLFHHAMILAPTWYDPFADRLCTLERAMEILADRRDAMARRRGLVAAGGMRLWKRGHMRRFLGVPCRGGPVIRPGDVAIWANRVTPELEARARAAGCRLVRVEDGFIRSVGLGAKLVPPLSIALDDLGIYYDPSRPSRLEAMIAEPCPDPERARRLVARLVAARVTKYGLAGRPPQAPSGFRILVPGQVEDDASIRLGAGEIRTNAALLARVRAENPDAVVIYKPHPDVEAGLRPGAVDRPEADAVWRGVSAADALDAVDAVWTMTSLTGFEALLRGKEVTCLGQPFYAGWGLTRDLGGRPVRRGRATLEDLVHAALIRYPLYRDPVTGLFCGPEEVLDRIERGALGRWQRPFPVLSKLQGLFAGLPWLWR